MMLTSYLKSNAVNQCAFTLGTLQQNLIPVHFEATEPWAFLKRSPPQEEQDE